MLTSAQALSELLTRIDQTASRKEPFLTAAANSLGLQGEMAEVDALKAISKIYFQIEEDIKNAPFTDHERSELSAKLAVFRGVPKFSQAHFNIEQAKNQFLKSDNIVGLMFIQMALSGHITRPQLDGDTTKLAEEARNLAEEIVSSGLPDNVKTVLSRRLLQISSVIDHYNLFGVDAVVEQLETLLGTLFVHREAAANDEEISIFRRMLTLTANGISGAQKADQTLGVGFSLTDKIQFLLEVTGKI